MSSFSFLAKSLPLKAVGDAHFILYRLLVVTWGAKAQDGGGIAQACIEDPKVCPGILKLQ